MRAGENSETPHTRDAAARARAPPTCHLPL